MEIIAPFPNINDLRISLINNYHFSNYRRWESNHVVFPDHLGNGSIELFESQGLQFMRGNWSFKHQTTFRSPNPVGNGDLIDFRIGKNEEVRSAYLEGFKKYEWDISKIDGVRIMIPSKMIEADNVKILHKFQRYIRNEEIQQLLDELFSVRVDSFLSAIRMEWKFLELSHNWLEFFNNKDIYQNFSDLPDKHIIAVKNATAILKSNIEKPPTIKELGKRVGLNQQYLKVAFRRIKNISIYQFLVHQRMIAANKLIVGSQMPVQEVASKVGYADSSHFAKVYRKYYRVTPLKHRYADVY